MKIKLLLNPVEEQTPWKSRRRLPAWKGPSREDDPEYFIASPRKREGKDAPVFEKGDPVGEVLYPPHLPATEEVRGNHHRVDLWPPSNIEAFPRHIPYNSDKREFFSKTGRKSFEVFQYTFRYLEDPEEQDDNIYHDTDPEWTIMWDYGKGLVRMTSLFKCQGYAKTVPVRAIKKSPGLQELCCSITGGALAAQGYWMPFEAAKALAANFCFKIRFALTPLFGPDFVDMCTHPTDSAYKSFVIDPEIVAACAAKINGSPAKKSGRDRSGRAKKRISPEIQDLPRPGTSTRSRASRASTAKVSNESINTGLGVSSGAPKSKETVKRNSSARTVVVVEDPEPEHATETSTSPVLEPIRYFPSPAQDRLNLLNAAKTGAKRDWWNIQDADAEGSVDGETWGERKKRKLSGFSSEEERCAWLLVNLPYVDAKIEEQRQQAFRAAMG